MSRPSLTPEGLRAARQALGLTQAQLATMLDTDAQSVRRMEMPQDASTARQPGPRAARLVAAYLDGHRPDDWPDTGRDQYCDECGRELRISAGQ
ncbi:MULTISPECIES: helix-turn-helix domain-containing protein [Sulfitobacter]|uniref:Helix-turn-helix domain-containing protein n=1 Tax=Sulfitobacter profundi TaxID=2679961 RepID=A0ABW1YW31_9RHOB|nr:helix-turn-helix transcriptional regulator [Sulfitobacter indolifex]